MRGATEKRPRQGYSWNQNPIRNGEAIYNIASPLIYEHLINAGATYRLTDKTLVSLACSYVPPIDRVGPFITPLGAIPGASVSNALEGHFLSFVADHQFKIRAVSATGLKGSAGPPE